MNQLLNKTIGCISIIAFNCLIACTPVLVKKPQVFDVSKIERIELKIAVSNQTAFSDVISKEVANNLAGWNYPIGTQNGQSFSHILKATVGSVEHGSTPSGFSFSSGNSDPRAIEFQKTDVLPVSCQLTSIADPEQTTGLSMGFTASLTDKQSLSSDKLIDHISTVCFNLLRELKWPNNSQNYSHDPIKPSWLPEVRIETKDDPVKNDTTLNSNENRQQIIIHNQGSPVILHFGHERR